MLALYTLMCPWFCMIFVFVHGKAADHWTTPIMMQLRGFQGGEASIYQQLVAGGENIVLSCSALGKKFTQSFLYLAWSARSPANGSSTVYSDWEFIGGMNSTRHPHVTNPQRNAIDWRGFLSIRSVSKDQNGTEYRCIVKKDIYLNPDASFVELFVLDETAFSTPRAHATCTTDVTSKHSTTFPITRTQVTRTTDVADKRSKGPTKSDDHERSGISSDVGDKAFGIGVVVGIVVGVLGVFLVYVIYRCCKKHRSERLRRLESGTCSDADSGTVRENDARL